MAKPITAFVFNNGYQNPQGTVEQLFASGVVGKTFLLARPDVRVDIDKCRLLNVDSLFSSDTIRLVAKKCTSPYALFILHDGSHEFGPYALERLLSAAESSGSGLVYSDYYGVKDGKRNTHPVLDYQVGSIRDNFNFGSVLLFSSEALIQAMAKTRRDRFTYAGLYSTRLAVSRRRPVSRISEFLYSRELSDPRKSGVRQFDYVDPRNRAAQMEMEIAATRHLQQIGAFVKPAFKKVSIDKGRFECEASAIIPVRNRMKTIAEAVESALRQKTIFPFNLIVVDNHSTDGTTDILRSFAREKARVVHVVPQREDLAIGGCWNEAVNHEKCGRFAVQLDSDDLYKDDTTLQRIVDLFRKEECRANPEAIRHAACHNGSTGHCCGGLRNLS